MKDFEVTESIDSSGIKIVVVGVGGGGSNMVDHLVESNIADKVKLVAINTDTQALKNSKVPNKLEIGVKSGVKFSSFSQEILRNVTLSDEDYLSPFTDFFV
jgi:cell division GTPase FtsZ